MRFLNRKIRWMIFLFFLNFMWLNVLREIYEKKLKTESYEYVSNKVKIFDIVKNFKFQIINLMTILHNFYFDEKWHKSWSKKQHVQNLITKNSRTTNYDTNVVLRDFFMKKYSTINFLFVWSYMKKYLNIDESFNFDKFYCESTKAFFFVCFQFNLMTNIYTNFAIEIKKYLNIVKNNKSEIANQRKKLFFFYDIFSTHSDFFDVDKTNFKEIVARSRNVRKRKVSNVSDLNRFIFIRVFSVKRIHDEQTSLF